MTTYVPQTIDTSHVTLNPDLEQLVERLAGNKHDHWARQRRVSNPLKLTRNTSWIAMLFTSQRAERQVVCTVSSRAKILSAVVEHKSGLRA